MRPLGDDDLPLLGLRPPDGDDDLIGDVLGRRGQLLAARRDRGMRRADVVNAQLGRQALVGMLLADAVAGVDRAARAADGMGGAGRPAGAWRPIAGARRAAGQALVRVLVAAGVGQALVRIGGEAVIGVAGMIDRMLGRAAGAAAGQTLIRMVAEAGGSVAERDDQCNLCACHGEASLEASGLTSWYDRRNAWRGANRQELHRLMSEAMQLVDRLLALLHRHVEQDREAAVDAVLDLGPRRGAALAPPIDAGGLAELDQPAAVGCEGLRVVGFVEAGAARIALDHHADGVARIAVLERDAAHARPEQEGARLDRELGAFAVAGGLLGDAVDDAHRADGVDLVDAELLAAHPAIAMLERARAELGAGVAEVWFGVLLGRARSASILQPLDEARHRVAALVLGQAGDALGHVGQ